MQRILSFFGKISQMITKKLKIVFFGTPDFVIPVLKILDEKFDLVGIVTAPDQKVGRKQFLTSTPVNKYYQSSLSRPENGLTGASCLTPAQFTPDVVQQLSQLEPDLFVVAAYGKIIPKNILDIPKFGAINIHPSLLPKYRGPSPIQSAILNGDKVSGISIIKLDEKMDHGPIIYAEDFSLSSEDNFQTLSTKMFSHSAEILPKIIPAFVSGKLKLKIQDDEKSTFCKIIKKEDGFFDLSNFSLTPNPQPQTTHLDRMIRAYYPWPTAWTRLRQGFGRASLLEGKIVKFLPNNMIQLEGKKPMPLADFLRGHSDFPLKKL
jgi:methionyl-tRNA formyltransferase